MWVIVMDPIYILVLAMVIRFSLAELNEPVQTIPSTDKALIYLNLLLGHNPRSSVNYEEEVKKFHNELIKDGPSSVLWSFIEADPNLAKLLNEANTSREKMLEEKDNHEKCTQAWNEADSAKRAYLLSNKLRLLDTKSSGSQKPSQRRQGTRRDSEKSVKEDQKTQKKRKEARRSSEKPVEEDPVYVDLNEKFEQTEKQYKEASDRIIISRNSYLDSLGYLLDALVSSIKRLKLEASRTSRLTECIEAHREVLPGLWKLVTQQQ